MRRMSLKVLIAPDKFKGTLRADEAAAAIARGWARARPHDRLQTLPISDGGEGFGELLARALGAKPQQVGTVDAAGRPLKATWWWVAARRIAIIESARVVGLSLLPRGKFHPHDLDTRGLAAMLKAAAKKGARECLVGIGGSATHDGGFGLARALGWQFRDAAGHPIEAWTGLHRLAHVKRPAKQRRPRLIVAVDVQNVLLGRGGCSRVYGPQKGLRAQDMAHAEACLRALARVLNTGRGKGAAGEAGAGAAGGLGFGLRVFCGGTLRPGFALFARAIRLHRAVRHCEVVVTGEGAMDAQTVMGKGVGELAKLAAASSRRCLALAGRIEDAPRLGRYFARRRALTELGPASQAEAHAGEWLEALARSLACELEREDGCKSVTSTPATSTPRAATPRRQKRRCESARPRASTPATGS